jgi:hypothetical protein
MAKEVSRNLLLYNSPDISYNSQGNIALILNHKF